MIACNRCGETPRTLTLCGNEWLCDTCKPRGGCGKPGHTTASSDEGTCYCLTCQLEAENAALRADIDRLINERNDAQSEAASLKKHNAERNAE